MSIQIGPIILSPIPPASSNPSQQAANLNIWTRQAEKAIRQLLTYVQELNSQGGGSSNGQPIGGTTGQVLTKNSSTNYDSSWDTPEYIPSGGTTGQVLEKNSGTDYDVSWQPVFSLPSGGVNGYVLTYDSSDPGDVTWAPGFSLPSGGTNGQVLTYNSSDPDDVTWVTPSYVPTGGTAQQSLIQTGSGPAWSSNPSVRTIIFCSGYTPLTTGADVAEIEVPYASDGSTVLTYNVRRILCRVGTAGGAPAVTIEVSTGTGAFTPATVGTVTLSSGANEGQITTGFTTATVQSANKLRMNVGTLATAQSWTVLIELSF